MSITCFPHSSVTNIRFDLWWTQQGSLLQPVSIYGIHCLWCVSWNWHVNEMVTALVIVVVVFIIVIIINDILNMGCRLTMEKSLSPRLTLTFLPKETMFLRPGQRASRLRQEVTSWRFKHFCAPLNWHRTVCCDYIECNWYRARYNGSSCNPKEISKLTL